MCGIVGEGFWGSHTAYIQDPPPRTTVALAGDGTRCFSFQQVPPPLLDLKRSHTAHICIDKKKPLLCRVSPPFHLHRRPLSYLISYLFFFFSRGFERCVRSLFDSRLCALFIHTRIFYFSTFALVCVRGSMCGRVCLCDSSLKNPQVKNTYFFFL